LSTSCLRAAQAYAKVGLETGVSALPPHKLIAMLYEGALLAIGEARAHMQAGGDPQAKGGAISKAIQIIDEGLKASLDQRAGGTLAAQLWQLYEYMSRRLLLASLRNEVAGLDEVERLLRDIKEAWEQIEPGTGGAPAAAASVMRA
jgi:flagellar protein FliS